MAFCSYCGQELAPGARFCSACGSPCAGESVVPAPETAPVVSTPVGAVNTVPIVNNPGPAEYSVVLCSIGTCARSYADDLLEDILGYTKSEAKQILSTLPTQIAQLLTLEQAQYIAQALTEYGMQVVVLKGQSEIDLSGYAAKSVFNSDGSFITAALTALAGIGLANRLTRFQRWSRPSLLERIFAPRYRWTPPRHVTRAPRREVIVHTPSPSPHRAFTPQRLEQPRRTGDVIRGVSKARDNRSGIRSSGGHGGGGRSGGGPGGRH